VHKEIHEHINNKKSHSGAGGNLNFKKMLNQLD